MKVVLKNPIAILGLAFALIFPTIAVAGILGPQITGEGKIVDLSGLEWLELPGTEHLSRNDIEGGAGGFIAAGWRYASRSEAEALFDSLWGGTVEGLSADNYDGARWFLDHFGVADVYGDGYSSGGGSFWNLMFGNALECSPNPNLSCAGQVKIEDLAFASVPANSTFGFNVGGFSDALGLSTGLTPDNISNTLANDSITEARGSLLVRSVPEPSMLVLLMLGLMLMARGKYSRC
ncbi:MAG: PEP-CTERM sorting domain-containing protein [Pseudomonadales bacterium]|nr:PEP-CTERM sorting domain-containing protein [Pseudomonadales bacterium]